MELKRERPVETRSFAIEGIGVVLLSTIKVYSNRCIYWPLSVPVQANAKYVVMMEGGVIVMMPPDSSREEIQESLEKISKSLTYTILS